jgi:hypothetical protein
MKFSIISIIILTSVTAALPNPQFSWTRPSTGGGFNWRDYFNSPNTNVPTRPVQTISLPSTPIPTSTSTPGGGNAGGGNTGEGGGGTIGGNCTPQSAGSFGTENGIVNKNCCTAMTVIFARGTGETGNVGTVSGPPMFRALRQKLGNNKVTVQGVDYPASSAVSHHS